MRHVVSRRRGNSTPCLKREGRGKREPKSQGEPRGYRIEPDGSANRQAGTQHDAQNLECDRIQKASRRRGEDQSGEDAEEETQNDRAGDQGDRRQDGANPENLPDHELVDDLGPSLFVA